MGEYIIKDGELYHFKYIKKKKVNGKWRYYYDVDGAKKELNSYKKALSSKDEAERYFDVTRTADGWKSTDGTSGDYSFEERIARANKTTQNTNAKLGSLGQSISKYKNIPANNPEKPDALKAERQLTAKYKSVKAEADVYNAAKKNYEKAKTLVGKWSAVKTTFYTNNPKAAKVKKKAAKFINKLFKKK